MDVDVDAGPGAEVAAVVTTDHRHLFVYGTLLPGDVRAHLLAPFVVDEGWPDTITGRLFDSGHDYPAAILDDRAEPGGVIVGRTYALLEESSQRALDVLDEVEGVVGGSYRRVLTTADSGTQVWVYEYGHGLDLTPIASGDWLAHRPVSAARPLTDPTA